MSKKDFKGKFIGFDRLKKGCIIRVKLKELPENAFLIDEVEVKIKKMTK